MRYLISIFIIFVFASPASAVKYKEVFEKEFMTKPWAGEQIEESVCIGCHTSEAMKPEFLRITEEWKKSWHFENRVSCHNCHGGDPKDAALSMSPQRGFLGTPKYNEVPEFCGKCHAGILKHYLESGHGKALKASGSGPNCVTCHGSHNIQKANIEIISEQRCTRCHSYDRAKVMKQALFLTEKKIREMEGDIARLKREGIYTEEEDKTLFSTTAEFRTLFHSVDVELIKARTDEFTSKLNVIDAKIEKIFGELGFRKNSSAFFMLLFIGLAIVIFLISRTPKE